MSGSVGNPLKAIETAVPERIRAAREERDKAINLVLSLNEEIARLETIQQIGGEVAVPTHQGLEASSQPVRSRQKERLESPAVTEPPLERKP